MNEVEKRMSLYMNIGMTISMTVTATILASEQGAKLFSFHTFMLGIIAFVIACLVTKYVPITKYRQSVLSLFRLESKSTVGKLIGALVPTFIFSTIIGYVMAFINVGFNLFIAFVAFSQTYLVMFSVSYLTTLLLEPIVLRYVLNSRLSVKPTVLKGKINKV